MVRDDEGRKSSLCPPYHHPADRKRGWLPHITTPISRATATVARGNLNADAASKVTIPNPMLTLALRLTDPGQPLYQKDLNILVKILLT